MVAFVPAIAIAPWEYVADELVARDWTVKELAKRMGGDERENLACLCLLAIQESTVRAGKRLELGEAMANGLSRAFGTSAETWLNLDKAFFAAIAAGR